MAMPVLDLNKPAEESEMGTNQIDEDRKEEEYISLLEVGINNGEEADEMKNPTITLNDCFFSDHRDAAFYEVFVLNKFSEEDYISLGDESEEIEENFDDDVDREGAEEENNELVDELEEFRRHGLMTVRDPNYRFPESTSQQRESQYGLDAMRKYPQFFRLIPQNPHFRGLLLGDVDEGIQQCVYRSLWFRLVHLMAKALCTACSTDPSLIEGMMKQAKGLEKLGFDVRHIIARLKQPMYLNLLFAREEFESAKRRKLWSSETGREEVSSAELHKLLKRVLRETIADEENDRLLEEREAVRSVFW